MAEDDIETYEHYIVSGKFRRHKRTRSERIIDAGGAVGERLRGSRSQATLDGNRAPTGAAEQEEAGTKVTGVARGGFR